MSLVSRTLQERLLSISTNSTDRLLREAVQRINNLEKLVAHCWVHSGYKNCGRQQMDSSIGALYDEVVAQRTSH